MSMDIFDRRALGLRRTRARRQADRFDFLLLRVSEDIAERVSVTLREFSRVCVLGAAHGVTARALAACDNVGSIVEADISECAFQDRTDPLMSQKVVCDDGVLPFAPGAFDLIVAPLNLHLVNDLPGALIQIRKSLKPDGLFLASVLGGQTLCELRESMMLAEEEVSGGVSPRVFPVAEVREYGGLLQRAGFALPVTDSETVTVTYETPFGLLKDLRGMGATNVMRDRLRRTPRRSLFPRMAQIYAERYGRDDGRVPATFELITLTGWAPHESQQKPLKPGSAKMRLADALNTHEVSANEPAGARAGRSRTTGTDETD